MGKDKRALSWWEDERLSEDYSCSACDKCRVHKLTGRCMFGGPFKYVKVDYARGKRTEEEATGTKAKRTR